MKTRTTHNSRHMYMLCALFIMALLPAVASVAAETTQKKSTAMTKAKSKKQSTLTTDARFDDQAVGGKYQLPMEALSVVEDEKSIDDLIGVRKNFRDRTARSKGMR